MLELKIIISNSLNDPIYNQISNQIKSQIIKGDLQEGELLPSIRALAKDLQISVITTKRAYDELEKDGFVYTVPGKGTYVAMQNRDLLKERKLKIIEEGLAALIDECKQMDIPYKEIDTIVRKLFEED